MMGEQKYELHFNEDKVNDIHASVSYNIKDCCRIMNEQQYQIGSLIVDKEILTDNLDNAEIIIKAKDRLIKNQDRLIKDQQGKIGSLEKELKNIKENDFEGEEWRAITDKIENTFEVRNKDEAVDLCALLNTKDSRISELKIKLACLGHAIERAFNGHEGASCQLITEYYFEGIESHGLTDLPEDWSL